MGCDCSNSIQTSIPYAQQYPHQLILNYISTNQASNQKQQFYKKQQNKEISHLDNTIAYYQNIIQRHVIFKQVFQGLGNQEDIVGYFQGRQAEWYQQHRKSGKISGNPYDTLSILSNLKQNVQQIQIWYKKLLQKYSDSFQLNFGLGNLYYKLEQYNQSQLYYKKCIQINPGHIGPYKNIAYIYCYKYYINSNASEWAKFALKINKNNEFASLMRIILQNNAQQQIPLLKKLVQKFPFYTRIYNAIGQAYLQLNNLTEAIHFFLKGVSINPNYFSLYCGLAIAYNKKGDAVNALKYGQMSAKINPKHHEPYNSIGQAFLIIGKYEQAICWLQKSIQLNPQVEFAYLQLMKIYLKQDNIDKYTFLMQKLQKITNQNNQYLYIRALYYYKIGKIQQSLQLAMSIMVLQPNNLQVAELIGQIYFDKQQYQQSLKYFQLSEYYETLNVNNFKKLEIIYQKIGNLNRLYQIRVKKTQSTQQSQISI